MLRRFILPHRAHRALRTTVSRVTAARSVVRVTPVSSVTSVTSVTSGADARPRAITRAAKLVTVLFASAIGGGALGTVVFACGTTATTTLIAPITGVIVRADSLVAGHGCGEADSQVFGYAAALDVLNVIADAGDAGDAGTISLPLAGGSFPCYADGTFANLPPYLNYGVHVVAFNRKAWDAAGGKAAIDAASLPVDGGRPPIQVLNDLHPTWTTECKAKQQANIEVLADCDPLSSTGSTGSSASDGGP